MKNVGESIPPPFPSPISSPPDTNIVIPVFTQKKRPIEMEDVEK